MLVDDLIATGGTALAAVQLLRRSRRRVDGGRLRGRPAGPRRRRQAPRGRRIASRPWSRSTAAESATACAHLFSCCPRTYRPLQMRIHGRQTRTIWPAADGSGDVEILDQTRLPHVVEVVRLSSLGDAAKAIRVMQVRGAPLIGATAAYGVCLALRDDPSDAESRRSHPELARHSTDGGQLGLGAGSDGGRQFALCRRRGVMMTAWRRAAELCDEDVETCRRIGEHGLELIRSAVPKRGRTASVNVLTHCNAGWLATVDWGTALAPIYLAQAAGHRRPCLGRRDPAAQPGRLAHRLRARPAGRAAHHHRRQCRRPSDAARRGRPLHRRHRPHHPQRRRRQQDRHLPEGARGRATTACRSMSPCRRSTIDWTLARRAARDSHRGARPPRGHADRRPHGRRQRGHVGIAAAGSPAPTSPSTSRRPGWSPA